MRRKLTAAICIAAALWFYMFSPWTTGMTNFWLTMTFSAIVLTALALTSTPDLKELFRIRKPALQICGGIVLAFLLWGIFWLGDKVSSWMFDFARPGVDAVYAMKGGIPEWLIAVLLLTVIGPAEELFWRGFVQRNMASLLPKCRYPFDMAFLVTTAIYTLIHIWSFNFMLIMAALTAGFIWGFLYRLKPEWLPALAVSHAVWDAMVFVIIPI